MISYLKKKKYGVNICSNFNVTIKQFLKPKYEKLHKMQKKKKEKKRALFGANDLKLHISKYNLKKNLRIVYQIAIIFKKVEPNGY